MYAAGEERQRKFVLELQVKGFREGRERVEATLDLEEVLHSFFPL